VVREPLLSLGDLNPTEQQAKIDALFESVGLRPEQQRLFPHQFSGGQRQRIGIARALATQPELIICDEPVSALDVAVQAQILNLLRKLQSEFELTYLFISQDLGGVQPMCDSVAVMYRGKIVEQADRLSLFNNPQHPYTKALLSAVPSVDKKRREATQRILIPGDPPDPLNPPPGCRFANRCPVATDHCKVQQPALTQLSDSHQVACHLVT
jgi:peptide/nickel transport system ATP-binding protein